MENIYVNNGNVWTKDEEARLLMLYNSDKLTIGEICKIHKRFIGGITSRLKRFNIISSDNESRGYYDFISSDEFNEMQKEQDNYRNNRSKNNKENKRSYISKNEFNELKKEITELKIHLKDIKQMIKRLDIYELE